MYINPSDLQGILNCTLEFHVGHPHQYTPDNNKDEDNSQNVNCVNNGKSLPQKLLSDPHIPKHSLASENEDQEGVCTRRLQAHTITAAESPAWT